MDTKRREADEQRASERQPDPRLSAAGRELDLIHKNVNIRGNLLG